MQTKTSVAIEISVIAFAALVFVATFQVRPSYVDFVLAALAVLLIVASTARSRRFWADVAAASPTGRSLTARAAMATAAFTGAALLVLAAVAALGFGPDNAAPWYRRLVGTHFFLAMLLYFPWALLQQFIFQFYLFGRLLKLVPLPAAVALTAAAFASVHYPRWPVMAVTVIAGAFWALTYYRYRRLLPLAASHAILGAALHYWVFDNDLLEGWNVL
jgi:membrane protease YdiL (CAAX protease family)